MHLFKYADAFSTEPYNSLKRSFWLLLGVGLRILRVFLLLVISVHLFACSKDSSKSSPQAYVSQNDWRKEFPQHWWQEVPREEAKSWEILPQDAGFREVILSKRNELGLLSNFADTSFVFHGVCYPSVEGFWQMMKYPEGADDIRWSWSSKWKWTRAQVSLMNGYDAKKAGNYINYLMDQNDANWVTFMGQKLIFASMEPGDHYQLILKALIEKVRQNPEVRDILLRTRDLKLVADHRISSKAPREWHYNLLWMDIRRSLLDETLSLESSEDLSLKTCRAQRF